MTLVRIAIATLTAAALTWTAATAAPVAGAQHTVLDLGDSLSVGTAPYLAARLPGYRVARFHDVGLHAYDAAAYVSAHGSSLPGNLVVSAGTNDDPRIVSTFWRAASTIVRLAGPHRCVVWPTIVRPPAIGTSYDGLNRALTRVAARYPSLVVVDWVGMVAQNPQWLATDGVHVNVAGYRARATAIAAAIRNRCG